MCECQYYNIISLTILLLLSYLLSQDTPFYAFLLLKCDNYLGFFLRRKWKINEKPFFFIGLKKLFKLFRTNYQSITKLIWITNELLCVIFTTYCGKLKNFIQVFTNYSLCGAVLYYRRIQ